MIRRDTLLIVDDLEMNRAILSNILKKKYKIVEASDGDEALEYIKENSHKTIAILLDLVMPRVSGIEVLRAIKYKKIADEVPIFIITAKNSEKIMYEAYELGVKDILEKPFVPYFLKKRIENVIEFYEMKENHKKILENLNKDFNNILNLALEGKTAEIKKFTEETLKKLTI